MKKFTHNHRFFQKMQRQAHRWQLLAFLSLLFCIQAHAQMPLTPNGQFDTVFDRMGNKYPLQSLAVNDTVRNPDSVVANTVFSCTSGYFRVYLEPGCGLDSATTTDSLRRKALCRVLYDISQFIHSPLTANGNKINIWVRNHNNVPGASGVGYGTSFYTVPAVSGVSGIADNVSWITIHSGVDGYTGLSNPFITASGPSTAAFFHTVITFDFDSYTWHTNLSTSPSAGVYDFYTVALREITHALGFVSEVNSDGSSLLGANNYYSRYDKFLQTHSGIPVIVNTGSYSMYNYNLNSLINTPGRVFSPYASHCVTDSTNCDTALKYVGAVTEPVYTPNCYERGFSLSCFEDECTGTPNPANNNTYFTLSNVTKAATIKRYLKPEERKVLCDIGYTVDTVFGDTTNLNFYSYGGSVCTGITVAGINDGMDANGGLPYYSALDGKVQINGPGLPAGTPGILDNDVDADSFEGLQVLQGGGTLNVTSGISSTVVKYTPVSGDFGPILLRYTPVNSTTGQRGNIAYARAMVSVDPGCPTLACELANNRGFTNTTNCGVIEAPDRNLPVQLVTICDWRAMNTPDLYKTGCGGTNIYEPTYPWPPVSPLPAINNGGSVVLGPLGDSANFVGVGGGWVNCHGNGWEIEGLKTQLAAPLIPGGRYVIDFYGRVGNQTGDIFMSGTPHYNFDFHNIAIQFYVSNGDPEIPLLPYKHPLCTPRNYVVDSVPLLPLMGLSSTGFLIHKDNTWNHFHQVFTYTGPAAPAGYSQSILVANNPRQTVIANGVPLTGFRDYAFIDIISITPVMQTYPPISACYGVPFSLHPDSLVMVGGYVPPIDTFAWTPTGSLSCSVCPTPTATLTATEVFTVTDSLYHCSVLDTVNVYALPVAVATSNTPCANDTLRLHSTGSSGFGALLYSWSGPSSFSSTLASPTRVPPVAGIYTLTITDGHGCSATATVNVTVPSTPSTITGPNTVCTGATITLSSGPSGGTWSSSNMIVGTIGASSGIFTGLTAGTTTISYTLSSGCMVTTVVTVSASPAALTGTLSICKGSTTTLGETVGGGTWSPLTGSVAFVSTSGVVTGSSPGTAIITYSIGTCSVTAVVTVNDIPVISGTLTVCTGATTTLGTTVPGGTWNSSNHLVATVDASGIVSGVSAGTTVISYVSPAGCSASVVVTVYTSPAAIMGVLSVCQGFTTTLTDSTGGGTWSPSTGSVAFVSSSGVVTGLSAGTATISYTNGTCTVTAIVTVNAIPVITGTLNVCTGKTTTLNATPSGGTWTSITTSVATIGSSSGIVTGVASGTTIISYVSPAGCATSVVVTVNPTPSAITGTMAICSGSTTTLHDATGSGTWTSSATTVATVDTFTGVVTGVLAGTLVGTAVISYIVPTGCFVTAVITINPLPTITGTDSVCTGLTVTLTGTPTGGTWDDGSFDAIATVNSSGVVTGHSAGTASITYTTIAGCVTRRTITVHTSPAAISGTLVLCAGQSTTLADAPSGGTWASSTPAVGTINPSTGKFVAISGGTTTITYTVTGGCRATAVFTVNPLPGTIFAATASICIGDTVTVHDLTAGGTWSSSNTLVGTIGSLTGLFTGLSSGTTIITYTLPTGCFVTVVGTVNPVPVAITGTDSVCVGSSTTFFDGTLGGTWSSSATGIATVGSSTGKITGVSGGTATISYILGTGCYVTRVVKVKTLPVVSPIICDTALCVGEFSSLSDTTLGGTWDFGGVSGIISVIYGFGGSITITGIAPGSGLISYSVTNFCGTTTVTKKVSVVLAPTITPIYGVLGVCSGYTDTLHDGTPGGTWSSSDPAIISINPSTGVLTGIAPGSVTITYTVTNPCTSIFTTVNVLVNMEPYITANFITACQTLSGTSGTDASPTLPVISGNSTCIYVCDSTVVRYHANGVAGSGFTWDIAGGTIITNFGDSIDVFWSTVGLTGSIVLHDTFHHCIDSARACIKVIDKPKAHFTATGTSYCMGDNVAFIDMSAGDPSSPILYYHWDFGDGTGSSVFGSTTHTYATWGTFTVTLVVRNQCNCSDSFKMTVTVDRDHGPDIQCPGVVCDSGYAIYTTSATCGTYNWSVTGGTIVAGTGTASITVHWDVPDSSGTGYVSLETPGCFNCNAPTTIKVPVVLQTPKIEGNDTVCANTQYEYKLPLWPGTQYMWGVLGSPSAVVGCHEDYKVVVSFTPGTHVLHGWYQNRLKLCGGNVFKTIVALPPTAIAGAATVCAGASQTYSLTGGYGGSWTLRNFSGSIITTASGTTFTYSFPTPGTYLLSAAGSFCADPLTITVMPIPGAIDSITGPDTVCLGRVYSYQAWNNVPGTVYNWNIVGGTVSPVSGTDIVTVVWTSTTTRQLSVQHVSTTPPFCGGPLRTKTIYQEVVNPNVTGDTLPCPNVGRSYSANYTRGEVYDWAIYPNTAGSVVSGNHAPDITVLWNNTSTAIHADLVLTLHKCDTTVTDTLHVHISGVGVATVACTSPTPACPSTPLAFEATPGGTSYIWNWGDGTSQTTPGNTVTHYFRKNIADTIMPFHVHVRVINGGTSCTTEGDGDTYVWLYPSPAVYISSNLGFPLCPGDTAILTAHVDTNAGAIVSYAWYGRHPHVLLGTGPTCPVSHTDTIVCVVQAANGCADTSDAIIVIFQGCGEGGLCHIHGTFTQHCNTITVNIPGGTGSWFAVREPLGGPLPLFTNPVSASYDAAGIYVFKFNGYTDSCVDNEGSVAAYLYMVPAMRGHAKCGPGGTDTLFLYDATTKLAGVTITAYQWSYFNPGTGTFVPFSTAPNPYKIVTAGSTDSFRITVTCTLPDGTTETCSHDGVFSTPPAVSAVFTYTVSPICEKVPVIFAPTSPGSTYSYFWDFGDGATLKGIGGKREYTWNSAFGNPNFDDVKLKVIDIIGCEDSTTETLQIRENLLTGDLGLDEVICSNLAPFSLTLTGLGTDIPVSYLWSTDTTTTINTIDIRKSGAYWVTSHDALQCQKTFPTKNVTITQMPAAHITGVVHYCDGDVVKLNGYVGDSILYHWYRNGSSILSGHYPLLNDPGRPPGIDTYKLVIEVVDTVDGVPYSCFTADSVIVRIYALPAPPTIIGPTVINCGLYHLQLKATEPVSGTYNWVGNASIADSIYNINSGGPYRVWFTDLHGCVSHRDTTVPLAPDTYFPYFPDGCFTLCHEQMPVTLYGPPCVSFTAWEWLLGCCTVSGGTSSEMTPYSISGAGNYRWGINNGLCTDTSATMSISLTDCNLCQDPISATLACIDTNAASYSATVVFTTYGAAAYTIGTGMGPVTPFTGEVTTAGTYTLSLTFTTLVLDTIPDSVTVQMIILYPTGGQCYRKVKVYLPHPCGWVAERSSTTQDGTQAQPIQGVPIANALMVFPNPSSGMVTIAYDYGNDGRNSRSLAVYDMTGQKMEQTEPAAGQGSWKINTAGWASGMYMVRMEGDGRPLQVQRIVIMH